jgi:predicted anti-sigma-YlaC factor YlaD
MNVLSPMCERARSWASLRVDGELSELESALLEAHLGRCSPCRAFARGAEDVAVALATARLERPAPLALLLPPNRRRQVARAVRSAAAATLVAAIGAGVAVLGIAGHAPTVHAKPVAMVAGSASDSLDRFRELRRASLIRQNRAIPRNRLVPGESL